MLGSTQEYRESLRTLSPEVYLGGERVSCVADEPRFAPGINAVGVTYDLAARDEARPLMVATEAGTGAEVNRMLHLNRDSEDLLAKLEAVRLVCRESGCAQRYLAHDALNAIHQMTYALDADGAGGIHQRFLAYLHLVQARDLAVGIAMTDGKGDRALRPGAQREPGSHLRIVERSDEGIFISGVKAIVTGAPYMHELLVMPGRSLGPEEAEFAVCCAVPIDAPGLKIIARPAGRPGEAAAKFSGRYGQATAVCLFDRVFVPAERVFLDGRTGHTEALVRSYASHHRHSCIGARAGFGDLLIGAGLLMTEANGLDPVRVPHIREGMVELIKLIEGFYACGVAASVYGLEAEAGNWQPEPVFANVGKLMLASAIYEMHRLAHEVSGGLVVALPGPEEDHNPAVAADLEALLKGRADVSYAQRMDVARLIEDLTASDQGGWYSVISLHGGGSPQAMKREIYRSYPLPERRALVQRLLERGAASGTESGAPPRRRQPGQCCAVGCRAPEADRETNKGNEP